MRCLTLIISCFWAFVASAEETTIAVASNFLSTAEILAKKFETETDHKVILVHGSTGQLYAQIANGAPFDILLAADTVRPSKAVENGIAIKTDVYALGRLVLVSKNEMSVVDPHIGFEGKTVALADPTVAPYGYAAVRVLEKLKLDTETFQPVLVANVGQVATVFATGNAGIAFISEAQIKKLDAPITLSLAGLHPPIEQGAALLSRAGENAAALDFWAFVFSDDGRAEIAANGYDLP